MIFRDSAKKENRGKIVYSVCDRFHFTAHGVCTKKIPTQVKCRLLISSIFWEMLESNFQYIPKNTGNSFTCFDHTFPVNLALSPSFQLSCFKKASVFSKNYKSCCWINICRQLKVYLSCLFYLMMQIKQILQ